MCPSSISSSDAPASMARTIRNLVILTIFFLVLIDLGVRFVEPIELHDDWESQQVAVKLDAYRKFVEKNGGVDVLIYGSSVTMNMDAARISDLSGGLRVFSGGIGSLRPETARAVYEYGYLPIAKPGLIIYGISPRSLRDPKIIKHGHLAPLQSHVVRSARASGFRERTEIVMENISALVRIRRQMRDLIERGEIPKTAEITIRPDGSRKYMKANLETRELKGETVFPADFYYRSRYNRYHINELEGQYSELRAFIEELWANDTNIELINMPLAPACFSLFDNPETDPLLYTDAMSRLVDNVGIAYHDAHADLQLDNSFFANADHLGEDGARAVESYIVDILNRDRN